MNRGSDVSGEAGEISGEEVFSPALCARLKDEEEPGGDGPAACTTSIEGEMPLSSPMPVRLRRRADDRLGPIGRDRFYASTKLIIDGVVRQERNRGQFHSAAGFVAVR